MRKLLLSMSLLVLLAGVLAGCGAQVTAPDIIAHLKDTATKTQDLHMVVDLSFDTTAAASTSAPQADSPLGAMANLPKSGKATIELWYKQPNLMRAEIRSVDTVNGTNYTGATFVNDGTTLWAYDPTHNMAYKLDMSAVKSAGQMVNLPTEIQDLLSNPNLASALDQVLSLTDATQNGTEKVAGFDTYKLTLMPKADSGLANAALGVKATMWVDQATWTVVKLDATSAQGNFSYSTQTLDFNKGIAADKFTFTMPAGAKGMDLTMFAPRSVTLDEARTGANAESFTLLTPSYLPTGAQLTSVTALPLGQGYVLRYSGSANAPNFTVFEGVPSKMPFGAGKMPFGTGDAMGTMMSGAQPAGATTQTVQVRGVEGKAFTKAADAKDSSLSGAFVTWQEKNSTLHIGLGGALSLDETLKIAESLK